MSRSLRTFLTVYPLLTIAGFVMLTPLFWMVVTAFKSTGEVLNLNAPILPVHWDWHNIAAAWDSAPFGRFYINSVIFTGAATFGQIVTSAMAGYAFARVNFPLRNLLFYATLAGLMIPFTVIMLPVVDIVSALGWLNTYQGLIVPNMASAFGMFLFRQHFLSVPKDMDEAARIDGASRFRAFLAVGVPLAQPVIAAFGVLSFLVNWNNFLFPLLVTNTTHMMVLPLGLAVFHSQYDTQYNLLMAAAFIAVMPIFVVSLFAQRRLVEGITLGALK